MRIVAAVLGRPITHSKSPALHRAAFAVLGLTTSEYTRFDVGEEEIEAFLDSHPDHTGFSLTMPLKDRLVEIADERGWIVDETARLTGAGNTLVRRGQATEVANTDVRGIVRAIAAHLPPEAAGTDSAEKSSAEASSAGAGRATILGAGATAASALVACRELGTTRVEFLVRSPARARRVLDLARQLGIDATTAPLERIADSRIVISTLPAEAAPDLTWEVGSDSGRSGRAVALDVAYASDSAFLAAAAAHGLITVEGTAMLVEQAVAQSEMFLAAAGDESAQERSDDRDRSTESDLSDPGRLRTLIAGAMYAALDDPDPVREQSAAGTPSRD